MRIPLNQNGGENAAQAALLFKALNPHRTGIRQFIAREAKHFFAQRFGGKEAFAAIGQRIFRIDRSFNRLIRQQYLPAFFNIVWPFRGYRQHLAERARRAQALQKREQPALVGKPVDLVGNQQRCERSVDLCQRLLISRVITPRFNDKQAYIDCADRGGDNAIEGLIERAAVARLESRRINKNILRFSAGIDPLDTITGRLRFARSDADFLLDERIQQGRFTHVWPPDNGNGSTAECHLWTIFEMYSQATLV